MKTLRTSLRAERIVPFPCALFLSAIALALPATAQSRWGLRNIRLVGPGTTTTEFQQEFQNADVGNVAFWLWWGDIQPTHSGQWCFQPLHDGLDRVESIGAIPVIAFHADAKPAYLHPPVRVDSVTILDSGSGYEVGDIVQLQGGTLHADACTHRRARFVVNATYGGAVQALSVLWGGAYVPGTGNPPPIPTLTSAVTGSGTGLRVHPTMTAAFWAMNFAGASSPTGPKDLCPPASVSCTSVPGANEYSATLYAVGSQIATEVATKLETGSTVYIRFHVEPWDSWPLGGEAAESLDNYLLSYLTFRQGVLDANTGIDFLFGHGALPRGRLVPESVYGDTELSVEQKLDVLNSDAERNQCVLEDIYDNCFSFPLNASEADCYVVGNTEPIEPHRTLDAWMDAMVAWTACGIFDFTTVHLHGKPRYFERAKQEFEERVLEADCTWTPIPWIAAEAAFELLDQLSWQGEASPLYNPGPALDTFIAEDYVRKWAVLLGNDVVFCSPILADAPKYRGLYELEGDELSRTDCASCDTPLETISSCPEALLTALGPGVEAPACPRPARDAFLFLSGTIGTPTSRAMLHPSGLDPDYYAYRFGLASGAFVDIVWNNELWDASMSEVDITVTPPSGYPHVEIRDIDGTVTTPKQMVSGDLELDDVGQRPIVLLWNDQ